MSVRFIFITRHSCGCSQFASPTLRDTQLRRMSVRCIPLHSICDLSGCQFAAFHYSLSRSIAWVGCSIARAARLLHNSVRRWRISAVRFTLASGLPRYCRKGLRSCAHEPECVRYVSGLMCCKTASPSVCSLVKPFPAARVPLTCAAYVRLFYAKPLSDLAQKLLA